MIPESNLHTEIEARLRFETLIADLSSKFVNVPAGAVDSEIMDAERLLCEFLGLDLAALWQWSAEAPGVLTPTHVYTREGLQAPGQMRQEQFPWYVQQMLAGCVVAFSSLEELPAEAAVDRETCRQLGIKSNLTIPLSVGGEPPVGILGLNTTRMERDWPDALVKRLQLLAQIFSNALARKRADQVLRESEERLSLAAEYAEAGFWVLDFRTRVFWATEEARAIFGYSPEEVVSMDRFKDSVHPDDWDLLQGSLERSVKTREAVNVEYRIRRGDGSIRWIASRGRPHFAPAGEPLRLMGASMDITDRKGAEEALRASEARVEAGADLAGLGCYEVDFVEPSCFADDWFHKICGGPAGHQPGLALVQFWMQHLHPEDTQHILDQREKLHDGRLERLSIEYRYLHPTQGLKWIHHLARVAERDATGRAIRSYGAVRDITLQKQAQEALHDLSGRLIRAHEEERARLARELHDDVTQRLARLAIDAGRMQGGSDPASAAETMRSVRDGLVRLSEDIHSLSYRLHPSLLEDLGLAEALKAECEQFSRQGPIAISLKLQGLPAFIPPETALCLFRVAQEALRNVARHARARGVEVSIRTVDGGLQLAVIDDGIGFEPAGPRDRHSLGLAGMRERLLLLDGELEIESTPGKGTTVLAWAPLKEGQI